MQNGTRSLFYSLVLVGCCLSSSVSFAQQAGKIVGWSTKISRYNPGSLEEQDLKYIFHARTGNRVIDFDTGHKDFNVGDEIKYELREEKQIVISKNNAAPKSYRVVGIEEDTPCK